MQKKRLFFFGVLLSVVLLALSISLLLQMYKEAEASKEPVEQTPHSERTFSLQIKTFESTITLGAIGDILIHDWVYNDAKTNHGYDFKPMFKHVKDMLEQPDILLANQETILGGDEIGISSYPMFNSPQEVGDALVDAGVDIVSTANNHSLDKGEKGLLTSLSYMDKIGLPYVGTYTSPEEQQTLTILSNNGINIAYLSYTYGTNGIPVPQGKDHLVNLINQEKMKDEIHRAKEKADVIVMSLHWGNEYQLFPTDGQKELGHFLINEGVDILFGHHPHVLQPMEWVKTADGRESLIVYSLGNFLSGQMWDYKDIGGMATIEVTKTINEDGRKVKLANPEFYPTYVSNQNLQNYRVVPLQDAEPYGLKNAVAKYDEIMSHMTKELQ
ncbi:CapA family protein [Cytobacillus sp. FJAT-54145]|uniref:CapA family protein n=1 Tax=Cytobacillus spartinae TaxID=3299023 RepID=A0ABW6K9C1_9BACI